MQLWKDVRDGWSLAPNFSHWCSCIFISYLYKQASRLLCWAVNGWSIQLKRSKVSEMVRDKPWLCLRCFQIEAGKTTQKDHAGRGVTEIQRGTWRLFTQGHPSEPWKKITAYIIRNVIFRKTHTLHMGVGIFWWPYLFRIDLMQEYSIWRSSGKELCITE